MIDRGLRWLSVVAGVGALALVVIGGSCSDEGVPVVPGDGAAPDLPVVGPLPVPWAVSAGDSGDDVVVRVAGSAAGEVVIAGYSIRPSISSPYRPARRPATWRDLVPAARDLAHSNPSVQGSLVAWIAKVGAGGKLLWVVPMGGVPASRLPYGLAVDQAGSIYYAGSFSGTQAFGSHELTAKGAADIVVAKLDPSGRPLWAVAAGGPGTGTAAGIHNHALQAQVNPDGMITVAGAFVGTVEFGPVSLTAKGPSDLFVAQLESDGSFRWAVQAGSSGPSGWEGVTGLAVDQAGNSMITGAVVGNASFGSHFLATKHQGESTLFVAKLDPAGRFLWVSAPPASHPWEAISVALDAAGNGYLSGRVGLRGASVPVVAKIDPAGKFVWETHAGCSPGDQPTPFGGGIGVDDPRTTAMIDDFARTRKFASRAQHGIDGVDAAPAIVVDDMGSITVAGHFSGTKVFGSTELVARGPQDAFLAGLDASGAVLWAEQIGGDHRDWGVALTLAGERMLYLAGNFQGTLTLGSGPLEQRLSSQGDRDIYLWNRPVGGP